jgi:hypothetical protein
MKRLILAAAAVLSLAAGSAQAATYTYVSTTSQEAIITDARARYNASLPQTIVNGSGQTVANPALLADNVAFIGNLLLQAINSWDQTQVRAPVSVAEKNLVYQLLNADIARGDTNSPTATALLARMQANP